MSFGIIDGPKTAEAISKKSKLKGKGKDKVIS